MAAAASYSAASCRPQAPHAGLPPHSPMTLKTLYTLQESLKILSDRMGAAWTRGDLLQAMIKHSLPLRATTPNGCREVIYSMGKQHKAGLPDLGYRRHALMLTSTIKELLIHGESRTNLVGLEPGDPEYQSWAEIKARRLVLRHSEHTRHQWEALWPDSKWVDGDYMGESSVVTFSKSVNVNDETCRVPVETIEELLALSPSEKTPAPQPAAAHDATNIKHRIKRNSLDDPIEMAIKRAGSTSLGAVWVHLRIIALEDVLPFTGLVEDDALYFTNDNNQPAKLGKDALRKRLEKYRKAERG